LDLAAQTHFKIFLTETGKEKGGKDNGHGNIAIFSKQIQVPKIYKCDY
jgi:hypothetical protein